MRVLIVGWMIGSGSTGVQAGEIGAHLQYCGHDVAYLSAGHCDWRIAPSVCERRFNGLPYFELRNPPIMPCTRADDPSTQISSPTTEALFTRVLQKTAPQVVALMDFPGWPASTVGICRRLGAKVLVAVHNMWPVCTRLALIDRWNNNCSDYQTGSRCVECMATVVGSDAARWRLRFGTTLMRPSRLTLIAKRLYFRGVHQSRSDGPGLAERYALRRRAYIQALSEADALACPSFRVVSLLQSFGVRNSTMEVARPLYAHFAALQNIRRTPSPNDSPSRPIRFCYIGGHSVIKGLHVLLAAFRGIAPEDATLSVYGRAGVDDLIRLKALTDPRTAVTFHGAYRQAHLSDILRGVDVGVVPSICEDSYPTTTSEFQAAGVPVIGSDIGGLPEQIDHDRNGQLVRPGDAGSLRHALNRVIADPPIVARWRRELRADFSPVSYWQQITALIEQLGDPS